MQRFRNHKSRGRTGARKDRTTICFEQLESRLPLNADLVAQWIAQSVASQAELGGPITEWIDEVHGVRAIASGHPEWVPNAFNARGGIRFDPRDQADFFRITAANNPLAEADDFTVLAVFSTSASNLSNHDSPWYFSPGIVDANGFGLVEDWGLGVDGSGRVIAGIGSPAQTVRSSVENLNDGIAHVAVLAREAGTLSVYANGQGTNLEGASDRPRDARDIKLGAGGLPFAGELAEVRLYRGRMPEQEVQQLADELLTTYRNLPPTVRHDSYSSLEDVHLLVSAANGLLANDHDPEGALLTTSVASVPSHGELVLSPDGSFRYLPDHDFFGADEFMYVLSDGVNQVVGNVTIQITNQFDAPQAVSNRYWTGPRGITVEAIHGVLHNDTNPDQTALQAILVTPPSFGTLVWNEDGGFTYQPQSNHTGVDTFTYRLAENSDASGLADVEIWTQFAPVAVSEWMAQNRSTLRDSDNQTSDWIEISNFGASEISLIGWFLTDNLDKLTKWPIPEITLAAGERRIVFASGKDRGRAETELHTNFRLSSAGGTVALVAPDGETIVSQLTSDFPQFPDRSVGEAGARNNGVTSIEMKADFLATPSPAQVNSDYADLGPIIKATRHSPETLTDHDDFLLTTEIVARGSTNLEVIANLRLMYGEELAVAMRDDGLQGDNLAADGVYSAKVPADVLADLYRRDGGDPNKLSGVMLRYRIIVSESSDVVARWPIQSSDGAWGEAEYGGTVFQDVSIDTPLPVLQWFVPNPNWHRIPNGNSTRWTPASVYFKGAFYDNIGVRVRGISTQNWSKPKFKFEFNPGKPFTYSEDEPPVDEFNLQSHFREKGATSYMGENLAFDFLQAIGVAAPNTMHLHVRQNGAFYSLSSFVEQVDETFLSRHDFDPNGALYKANSLAARSTLAVNPSRADYQKVTREHENYADLAELTNGLANRLSISREEFIFRDVNLPQVINNMAGNTILTNHDRLTKNYYMYHDTSVTGQWHQFPWDMDQAFALRTDANFSSLLYGDSEHPQATGQPIYQNHLLDAILDTPTTREMYLRRLRTLLDEYLGTGFFEQAIDAYATQIQQDAAIDDAKWQAGTLADGIDRLKFNLAFRYDQLLRDALIPETAQVYASNILIDSNAVVRVKVPTAEDDEHDWTSNRADFNDSTQAGWLIGTSGVGYERGTGYESYFGSLFRDEFQTVPTTLLNELDRDGDGINSTNAVYLRYRFDISNPSTLNKLELQMRFDDAFVAYINGHEVARSHFMGLPAWNASATGGNQEAGDDFTVFNLNLTDPIATILHPGENVLAIVGLNTQQNSPDFLIQPRLIGLTAVDPEQQVYIAGVQNNPASGNQDEEWIRLENPQDSAIDLSDWSLRGDVAFEFLPGTVIPSHGQLWLSPSLPTFLASSAEFDRNPMTLVVGPYQGRLDNQGGVIELVNPWNHVSSRWESATSLSPAQEWLRITEVHYHPGSDGENLEFIELTNTSRYRAPTVLDMSGLRVTDGPRVPYTFPMGTRLAPGESLILARRPKAFELAHPGVPRTRILGPFVGALSNNGESIIVEDEFGEWITRLTYDDDPPWPEEADGDGPSLELIAWDVIPGQGSSWLPSPSTGGSPATSLPSLLPGDFDFNGRLSVDDVDSFCGILHQFPGESLGDLDDDGTVDLFDLGFLVENLLQTRSGDANYDGLFTSADLVLVFQAGTFERPLRPATWKEGDWNCDRRFTTQDLVAAWQVGGYEPVKGNVKR